MPKNEKQKLKLLALSRLLLAYTDETHALTLSEIRDRLADEGIRAERKSLYDDIETLIDFGLAVEKEKRGAHSVYRLVERQFELPELKLLADAVNSAKFLSEKKSRQLIDKLASLTSVYEAGSLRREIYISDRLRSENEQVYYAVDAIHTAMESNRQVGFYYFEYNEKQVKVYRHGKKRYQVSPWGLIWSDGNYYMVAFDPAFGGMKHYRIDKMENTALLDLPRDGREAGEALDLSAYVKSIFGMYGGEETLVTLRVENRLSGVILDRFGHGNTFFDRGDGRFEVSVRVSVSPQFLGWIMSFGRSLTNVAPDDVVAKYKALAAEILEG